MKFYIVVTEEYCRGVFENLLKVFTNKQSAQNHIDSIKEYECSIVENES